MGLALFRIDADPVAAGVLVGAIALLALIYLVRGGTPQQMTERSGNLAAEPLPSLIYAAYRDRITGTIVLEAGGGRSTVYFRQGYPVGVSSPGVIDLLGRVLIESKVVDEAAVERLASVESADGVLLGRSLVSAGALTQAQLIEGLKVQVRRRLFRLFFLERGQFTVQTSDHSVGIEGSELIRIQPRRAIYQGIRGAWSAPRVRTACAKLAGQTLRLRGEPQALARYGFSEADQSIVAALSLTPSTVEELVGASGQPIEAVQAVACALDFTDALELTPARVAPDPAPPPRAAKATPTPDLEALRAMIDAKLRATEAGELFELLGAPRDAGKDAIKAAYLACAKVLHPDRFASAGLESLRPTVERVFRHINEAYATLYDDERRAAYLQGGAKTAVAESKARGLLEAEVEFQKGEVHLRKRDFNAAVAAFARAVELNPDEGEHIALHAWARVAAGLAPMRDVKTDLQRAIAKAPRCARAHCYLGIIYKDEGELDRAYSELKRALECDPNLPLAASEMRLVAMRREKSGKVPILDRFRKK